MNTLVTWIGLDDLRAADGKNTRGEGPIANALESRQFDQIVLLANLNDRITLSEVESFKDWLIQRQPALEAKIKLRLIELDSPVDYASIYKGVDHVLNDIWSKSDSEVPDVTFHLSPGTSQMAAVWILLATSKYPATLIQSSVETGVETVSLPFEIAAELVPHMLESAGSALVKQSATLAGGTFGDFTYESPAMTRLMRKALKAAERSIPVLIEGEPGTEKTQLAHTLHKGGKTAGGPFERLSCGAVPQNELGDLLFGSNNQSESGLLSRLRGGTLYVEEIERLPMEVQARLQREIETNQDMGLRFIISSRENLLALVTQGKFREELFYMLAVIVLKIPALRDRTGDLSRLLDHVTNRINDQSYSEPGFSPKSLSPAAKNFLLQQRWLGNLHELESTLRRAMIWSDGAEVSEADIWDAMLIPTNQSLSSGDLLGRPIEEGVDVQGIIAEVAKHYISRAIECAEGNKSQAAKLVGLPSYQTLSNWMKKYEL